MEANNQRKAHHIAEMIRRNISELRKSGADIGKEANEVFDMIDDLAVELLKGTPPRNCDRLSAEECKRIFAKEMTIYLPPEATDNDRTIATLTTNGVIDALYATAQAGGYDGSR